MPLHLSLAGVPSARTAAGTLQVLATIDAALLLWLCLEGATQRARLSALLWPDADTELARNALRQRLFRLRKSLGVDLAVDGQMLALPAGTTHDLDDSDTVLGQLVAPAGGAFAAWLAQQRSRRTRRLQRSLGELADMAEAARDWDDAAEHARELLALDPLSEEAHRRLMRLHYLAGDRAAALLAFDACERMLKDEVGARPSAQTLALLATIERALPPADATTPLPGLPQLARPPTLVGRATELDALRQCWHEGSPFLLLGEPGMGKSRLVEALVDGWPGAHLVRARPGDADVPLALLRRVAASSHGATAAPAWSGLSRRLEPTAAVGARPHAQPLDDALRAALAATLADGGAFVIDDWQFADEASASLLVRASGGEGLEDLRIGYASRSGSARVAALRSLEPRARVVEIAPWGESALCELLETIDAPPEGVTALADALVRRVGGNPMFVLETLRWMQRRGDPWLPEHVAVPSRLRELVSERLARLPDMERALLRIAALAGSDFSVELAETVSARNAIELAEAWRALEREGLLGPAGVVHDVYAEQARAGLPEPIARVLHARIAAWLAKRPCAPARLAAHWRAAGDDARALPHLRAAAHEAWRAARADECLAFFAQAAAIEERAGHGEIAFDLWFEAADAITELGSAAQCAECLAGLKRHAVTPRQALRVRLVDAAARADGSSAHTGLQAAAALLTEAIALGDLRVESECRLALARLAAADARFDEALQQLSAGERVLRLQGDERRAAAMAASIAMTLGHAGQTRLAAAELRRAAPLLLEYGDQATAVAAQATLVVQLARQGEPEAAAHEALQVLDAFQHASVAPSDSHLAHRALVDGLRWAGRFDLAWRADAQMVERLQRLGATGAAAEPGTALALHLGRVDLALPNLAALQERINPPGVRGRRAQLRLALWQQQAALTQARRAPWPDDAIATDDLGLAAEWALWSGLEDASPWSVAALQALSERCRLGGAVLFAAPIQALIAWRRGEPYDPEPMPRDASAPWLALFAAKACEACGDPEGARDLAYRGWRWLEDRAQRNVPEAFADAFISRQPAHRMLRAMVAGPTRQ